MNDIKENDFCNLEEEDMLSINGGTTTALPYGGALIGGCILGFAIGYAAA